MQSNIIQTWKYKNCKNFTLKLQKKIESFT